MTPVGPTISDNQTEQFTATGTFSDESTLNLTNQADWSSSNTAIATISTSGLATGVATGQSTITAAVDGITASTLLAVTSPLVSITVTPANPNIPLGETEQFTATGTLADGATENLTRQVTWASSNAAVATISAAGLATGKGTGTTSIAAAVDGITGSTSIKIALPPPVTVSLVQPVLNEKHIVTEIVVTFSGGVNATEAQDPSTFRLVGAGKGNSFTAKNATVIALSSAVYNGANDTVTLIPKKAFSLSKPVQLTINGTPPSGLQDSLGRFIDGNHDGEPGSSAVVVLRS